jgi:hypothetical protein
MLGIRLRVSHNSNCQYCLADGHREDVCFKENNGTPGQFSLHTSPSAAAVDVAPPAQDMSEISSAEKSIAASIQNLRNLMSGTDVISTDYTACQVQVLPRSVLDSAASHTICREEKRMTTYGPAHLAIRLANQTTTKAIGAGTALIQTGSNFDQSTSCNARTKHAPNTRRGESDRKTRNVDFHCKLVLVQKPQGTSNGSGSHCKRGNYEWGVPI